MAQFRTTSRSPVPKGRARSFFVVGRWSLLLALLLLVNSSSSSLDGQVPNTDRPATGESDTPRDRGGDSREQVQRARVAPQGPLDPAVLEFLQIRFEGARLDYAEKRFKNAWQICESILVLAPQVPFRDEVRQLRRAAQGRYIARSVVVVSFEPATDLAFPIAEFSGNVLIENHSAEKLVLGRSEKDPVLGLLHYKERTLSGISLGESALEGTVVVRMPEEIEVQPGETYRIPVTVALPDSNQDPLLQRWEVSGKLRPITVRVGRDQLTRGVPWIPSVGAICAEPYAEAIGKPLQNLRQAILVGDRERFIIAATLWLAEIEEDGPEKTGPIRAQVLEELLAALDRRDGVLDLPVIRVLEALTGEVRERTARSWKIWALTRPQTSKLPQKP